MPISRYLCLINCFIVSDLVQAAVDLARCEYVANIKEAQFAEKTRAASENPDDSPPVDEVEAEVEAEDGDAPPLTEKQIVTPAAKEVLLFLLVTYIINQYLLLASCSCFFCCFCFISIISTSYLMLLLLTFLIQHYCCCCCLFYFYFY